MLGCVFACVRCKNALFFIRGNVCNLRNRRDILLFRCKNARNQKAEKLQAME